MIGKGDRDERGDQRAAASRSSTDSTVSGFCFEGSPKGMCISKFILTTSPLFPSSVLEGQSAQGSDDDDEDDEEEGNKSKYELTEEDLHEDLDTGVRW